MVVMAQMTNSELQSWTQDFLTKYGQEISDMLGLPLPNITFQFGDTGSSNITGDTSGTVITLNQAWVSKNFNNKDGLGMLAHEVTHAVQQSSLPAGNKWTEAIADAVRYKLGLVPPGWSLSSAAARFVKLDNQQFQSISQQISQGAFNPGWLKNPGTLPTPTQLGQPITLTGNPEIHGSANPVSRTTTTSTTTTTSEPTIWILNGNPVPPDTPGAAQMTITQYEQSLQTTTTAAAANFPGEARAILQSWGIPITPSLQQLINQGVSNRWNMTTFEYHLEQTPEFQQSFPGIFDANGTLKMSPTMYLSTVRSYQSYAARTGVNLDPQRLAYLFRNDVSPAEFAQRAQAVTTLRTNKAYFDSFNEQLKQLGMQPLTRGEQFKFVMGEGNQTWYDIWSQASTRYSAEQAGLSFGHAAKAYTNLGQGIVKQIAGLGLTQSQMQSSFAKLAQDLQTVLPMSRIQKYGLDKQDLVELEFGGPRQAAVAQKVQQILANEKAFLQNRVSHTGLTGSLGDTARTSIQQPYAQGP